MIIINQCPMVRAGAELGPAPEGSSPPHKINKFTSQIGKKGSTNPINP